jgi:Condensation domain
MAKYYFPSLRQTEDWHIAYTVRKKSLPNLMRFQVELSADTDVRAFEKAYQCLVERHESLRTCFPIIRGQIMQRVDDYDPDRFGLIFLHCNDPEKLSKIQFEILSTFKNLRDNALSKGILLDMGGKKHFIFFIHHILSDYWSINILRREFDEFYSGFKDSCSFTVGSRNIQLGEYFGKRREVVEIHHQETMEYWFHKLSAKEWHVNYNCIYSKIYGKDPGAFRTKYFSGCEKLYQSHLLRRSAGQQYLVCMDSVMVERLDSFVTGSNVTKYAVLISCLMLTGFIMTGNDSVLIRSHFNNRNEAESECIVGNLLGTIYLYDRVDAGLTVVEFIRGCFQKLLESCDHIIYNSERLEALQVITRCFSHFNFIDRESRGGQEFEIHEPILQANNQVISPLFCAAIEFTNTIVFKWGYHLLFYNVEIIKKMSALYFRLLYKMTGNPDARVRMIIDENVNF